MRCLDEGMAHEPEVGPGLVVGEDHDDVGGLGATGDDWSDEEKKEEGKKLFHRGSFWWDLNRVGECVTTLFVSFGGNFEDLLEPFVSEIGDGSYKRILAL